MGLCTLQRAKDNLRVTDDASNDDINSKIEYASAVVIGHLKSQADDGWSDGTVAVPAKVELATLLIVTDLYEGRQVDFGTMERLLIGMRDPALA
jgi:hypothetical protein